jgi:hypothetical protein
MTNREIPNCAGAAEICLYLLCQPTILRYVPAPVPSSVSQSNTFTRRIKNPVENNERIVENNLGEAFSVQKETMKSSAFVTEASVSATDNNHVTLPGEVGLFQHDHNLDTLMDFEKENQSDSAMGVGKLSPSRNESIPLEERGSTLPPSTKLSRFDVIDLTEEKKRYFQESIMYLRLTVKGFSFSIGSHSRYCIPVLRILTSFLYISTLAIIISFYSGLPWLEKYDDQHGKALYPWWAVYFEKNTIASLEIACLSIMYIDVMLNLFAQGLRAYFRENTLANSAYLVILAWYLMDLINLIHYPSARRWSQGFRPIALARSLPKLAQVVSVFASTLMKSLKLTFFAATFLLITGCMSVVVTRYSCEKKSIENICASIRNNWGSLDAAMLSSFVLITSSGYARLFEDFLSIVFSSSKEDKTGALNFSILILMSAVVFGGTLGLTALYTASVFDSFKQARSQQYLKQLGQEHRYLIDSYIAACRAFDADEVDGLNELHIRAIIEEVMPQFRGHLPMISLLFRLIDVDQGGSVNVIEYCRLCGILVLNFQIVHEGAPEEASSSMIESSSKINETKEMRRRKEYSVSIWHWGNPINVMLNAKHKFQVTWKDLLKAYPNMQEAVNVLKQFCASKVARMSVFWLLWSHLILTIVNAQVPPFEQDLVFEQKGISNNTVTYEYRKSLNDAFDVFILATSTYLVVVIWAQYAFKVASMNTAMLFMPLELCLVFADFLNPATGNMCPDCIWYARILRSIRVPVIALSLEPFVPLMKAISQLLSTLAVYIAFFYIVLNIFANLGHIAFRDLGFLHQNVPALSFSTLQQTLTIAIELSTGDDWDEIRDELWMLSKQRSYDIFFVFFYIVFNLCTTNVVTSLAIECFEFLHDKESKHKTSKEGLYQEQAFDVQMHMKNDTQYEMLFAPDGAQEIWTGRNSNHNFKQKEMAKAKLFGEEELCCMCSKRITSLYLECSLCHALVHFDCWQVSESSKASWLQPNEMQYLSKVSFLHSASMPMCVSKLQSDFLELHFSVHVKKFMNLLDILILGTQVTFQFVCLPCVALHRFSSLVSPQ